MTDIVERLQRDIEVKNLIIEERRARELILQADNKRLRAALQDCIYEIKRLRDDLREAGILR